ncbi:MAG: PAS domain S-box protein [Chloroflexi bacterium]|nr:PAS domain S-box protein [Chloroflexota bacterium]
MRLKPEQLAIIQKNSRDEAAFRRIMELLDALPDDPAVSRLRQAVENSPSPIFAVGRDGRVTDSNAACATLFGRALIGLPYQDLLWAKSAALQQQVEAVFEGQAFNDVSITYRCKHDSARSMISRLYPVMDAAGVVQECIFANTDITERQQAENAQHEQETFFRTIVETAQEGIWIMDADLRTLYVNRRLANMLGFSPSEMLDRQVLEFLDQSGIGLADEQREVLRQAVQAAGSARYDVELRRQDGAPLWLLASVTALTDERSESGRPTGYLAMVTDITERKQAEADLRAASAYNRSLIEVSVDPLLVISPDGLIVDVNVAAESAVGWPRAKLINTCFSAYFTEPEQARGLYEQAKAAGRVKDVELALRRRDGTALAVVCSAAVYRDEEGSPQGIFASLHDITERKRVEDALRQSEVRNRALLEAIPDLIIRFSPDGRYVDVKPASYFDPLLPAEQLIGMNARDVLPPDLVPSFLERLERVVQSGETIVYEYEMVEGGQPRTYESRLVPYGEAEVLSIVRDITERKRDELALRQHSERLRRVLEEMPVMLDAFDQQTNIVFWNRECERVTGYSAGEIIGNPRALEMLYPDADQRAHMMKVWEQSGGTFRDVEWPLTCKNGEVKIISWSNIADHWLLSGWEFWSMGIDVTERKRAEAALRESEARFRAVFDESAIGIAVGNVDGYLLFVNPAFCKMLGYRDDELTGLHYSQITHPDDRPAEQNLAVELIEGKRASYQLEKRYVHKDGTLIWVRVSASAIRDENGRIQLGLALAEDITGARAAAQKALELATERERVQMVASFVQDASHEFRTPLSIISTSVYLLERISDLEGRQAQYEKITQQVKNLTALVENLLTMSRLDAELQLRRQPTDLNEMLRQAETALESAINHKQHRIRYELDKHLPLVPADHEKLHTALTNLLSNAVRFTPPEGEITLQTYRQEGEVVAAIQDTGVGISPEAIRRIFERFYREDAIQSPTGFGLGLPIASKAIELHGGRIEVESEPGRGSVFRVVLPLEPQS